MSENETDRKCPWCDGPCEWVPVKGEGWRMLCCQSWLCGWAEGGIFR